MWYILYNGEKIGNFATEKEAVAYGFEHYNTFETRRREIEPIEVEQPVKWETGIAKRVMDKIIWGEVDKGFHSYRP